MPKNQANHVKHATWRKGSKGAESTGNKGPAKTEPKHGKVNRIPYDANHAKRKMG